NVSASAAFAGRGIENVAGPLSTPANDTSDALTKSNPSGTVAPSSLAGIDRISIGSAAGVAPAATSSRSPDGAVIDPPPAPTTSISCTGVSGARSSTVMTPFCSDNASNVSDGVTGNPAAITGDAPPGI